MDPQTQSIIGSRTLPPAGAFDHWQAAPLRIALSLASGVNISGAISIVAEIHDSQTTATGTPLASLESTPVSDTDGPWTLDFTGPQMNQVIAPGTASRPLWLVIVATYAADRVEVLATRAITLHRSSYSGTEADPPAAVTYLTAAAAATLYYTKTEVDTLIAEGGGGGGGANLSPTRTSTAVTIVSDSGTDATILAADASNAGVLTAADKSKLDGIASGATANSADATLLARANHTGTQAISTVSGLQTALDLKAPLSSPVLTGVPEAPTAAANTNTTQIATTAFVLAQVSSAVAGLLDFKGNLDASASPSYPAASKGDTYYISAAGLVGGGSGKTVAVGDALIASADNAGGTEASVGASWFILEKNLVGALIASNNLSDLANAGTARTNLGLGAAALLATSTGGDESADAGKVAIFGANGELYMSGWRVTDANGYISSTTAGQFSRKDAGWTDPGLLNWPTDIGDGDTGEIATRAWATANLGGGGASGTKTIATFRATANEPPASSFATLDTRNSHPVLDFAAGEKACFSTIIPEGADLTNGLTFSAYFTATSATTGTIGWTIAVERLADGGQDTDADGFGTAQTITAVTVPATSGVIKVASVTFTQAQLPASLAAGDMIRICITRGTDTASGDAELHMLRLQLP